MVTANANDEGQGDDPPLLFSLDSETEEPYPLVWKIEETIEPAESVLGGSLQTSSHPSINQEGNKDIELPLPVGSGTEETYPLVWELEEKIEPPDTILAVSPLKPIDETIEEKANSYDPLTKSEVRSQKSEVVF
ncbi:MAG TPA: hypothetical protein DCF68_00015, partial [Cyanothece sp. UBA12306]|nr:hypothetical protein [Cyanothece sp. UBA12306]